MVNDEGSGTTRNIRPLTTLFFYFGRSETFAKLRSRFKNERITVIYYTDIFIMPSRVNT